MLSGSSDSQLRSCSGDTVANFLSITRHGPRFQSRNCGLSRVAFLWCLPRSLGGSCIFCLGNRQPSLLLIGFRDCVVLPPVFVLSANDSLYFSVSLFLPALPLSHYRFA